MGKLTSLSISNNILMGDFGLSIFSFFIREKLKQIQMKGLNKISDISMGYLGKYCSQLTRVNVKETSVYVDELLLLIKGCNNLQFLECNEELFHSKEILHAISTYCPNFKALTK